MSEITTNAQIVVRELMAEPDALPLVSACAVAGNGWQENLLRPVTLGKKDHGSDGFLQWRLDRLVALQRLPGWQSLPVQCRFFKAECKAKYPSLWAQLVNPGNRSLENLTANICDFYERPSVKGRVIDKRIGYAKQVMAMYDNTPQTIPDPVMKGIIFILNNFFGGTWTSVLGIIGLIYSALVYNHIQISNLPINTDWKPWVMLGLTLLFGMGGKPTTTAEVPLRSQEPEMNPTVIMKLISMIETFVPIIEKVLHDIPQIKADIANIKGAFSEATVPDNNVDARMQALVQKLNELGGNK